MTTRSRETLLVPGMLCDPDLWSGVDVPGVSGVPVAITEPTITGMAEQVLAAADGPFTLVGLSLGAIVGFEVLRLAPERVTAFCAISTNSGAPTEAQLSGWSSMAERTERGEFDAVVRDILPAMFAEEGHDERFLGMAHRTGPDVFRAQLAAQATRVDGAAALGASPCPVLAVCGSADALCPVGFHRRIAGTAPGGRLRVIPGAGHLLPIERPRVLAHVLREWLDELS
ncbi:alpha/beta hydrolase [Actinomadura viridis]|uniref:Pimeloyl-ACP methyl ester carboxylesterase n=1 Tax=Actinomadura viridis TaxID=58110 RepID=A0A931GK45_9ACTN|nr:alpha/beta hydrolase [Actinomadura viridis]MBG6086016.1 pimeloyl-ACP methyl ester carboxylesterase [Actinomadura viridis]